MVISLEKSFQSAEHLSYATQKLTPYIYNTGGPPLTRKPLTRFPLPRFLAYVRASGDFSVSRGPQSH